MSFLHRPNTLARCLSVGLVFIALGVAAGAFGAHGLKRVLSAELLAVWETAVRYQILHGMGLVLLVLSAPLWKTHSPRWIPRLAFGFIMGILLFSGSLYTLALTNIPLFGAITPIGGVIWLGTWLTWAWQVWR